MTHTTLPEDGDLTGDTLPLPDRVRHRLAVAPGTLAVYLGLYLPIGFVMNAFGKWAGIAEFSHDWQVLTCYGLYLVPASLWVRHKAWFDQYLHGLLFMGLLELAGYTLGTSIAHEGNLLDAIFTPRNFTLAMVLWFAVYLPAGNYAVARVERLLGR